MTLLSTNLSNTILNNLITLIYYCVLLFIIQPIQITQIVYKTKDIIKGLKNFRSSPSKILDFKNYKNDLLNILPNHTLNKYFRIIQVQYADIHNNHLLLHSICIVYV
jgi:hypothetical protein